MEVKHEVVSELWLRLRLQPMLLLRTLISSDEAAPPRRLCLITMPVLVQHG
jgi:hypothetical protein